MSERFVWKIDKNGQGHVYDNLKKKNIGQHKKLLQPLNDMWSQVLRSFIESFHRKINNSIVIPEDTVKVWNKLLKNKLSYLYMMRLG